MIEPGKFEWDEKTVDLVTDLELLRFNRRALRQKGAFLRVNSVATSLEEMLAPAIRVFEIDASERHLAKSELDTMGINGTMLMAVIGGAAMTAWDRLNQEHSDD